LDNSPQLVDICREKNLDVHLGSILAIPFASNSFDYTLCIAVIHHLSTADRRMSAINELIRITKPGGQILITVWSSEAQKGGCYRLKRLSESQPVMTLQQDRLVEWVGYSGQTCQRYYHFFIHKELDTLCETFSEIEIVRSYEEYGNYCVILRKN
jgi:SAM-dependent methyltransferase